MLPIVPHEFVTEVECCGCLISIERGDQAELRCNECNALIATVPTSDVEAVLLKLAMSKGVSTVTCPHCGATNVFSGCTEMFAFVCKECGEGVSVPTRSVN